MPGEQSVWSKGCLRGADINRMWGNLYVAVPRASVRRIVALIGALGITSAAFTGSWGGGSARAATAAPPDAPLVLTANLQEAYGNRDVRNTHDMAVFCDRVARLVPRAPDVLLLQEVRHSSASFVAHCLGRKEGTRYSIAVDPGRKPVLRITAHKYLQKETAIVLNSSTMAPVGRGGYIKTAPKRSQIVDGNLNVKSNAFIMARVRGSDMRLPLASLHLTPRKEIVSGTIDRRLRTKWVTQVMHLLARRYDNVPARLRTFGGDFNAPRCRVAGGTSCPKNPFWSRITGRTWKYQDSLHLVQPPLGGGVDFVFTRGGVYGGNVDFRYDPRRARGSSNFYSDHRFRWAEVGPDRTDPTAPGKPVFDTTQRFDLKMHWAPATDGGSGIGGYQIFRRVSGDWRMIGTSTDTSFTDKAAYAHITYKYFVKAMDVAHNLGPGGSSGSVTPLY